MTSTKSKLLRGSLVASGLLAAVLFGRSMTATESEQPQAVLATTSTATTTALELTDLGPIAFSTKLEGRLGQYDPVGKQSHHFSIFRPDSSQLNLVHTTLDTGVTTVATLPVNCHPNGPARMHPTKQRAYFVCNSWGYVFEYDIVERKFTFHERVFSKGLLPITFGDDHNVYIGGSLKFHTDCPTANDCNGGNLDTHAYRFDVETRTLHDLGAMNDPGRPWTAGYGYVYYIGSDGQFVFSGIGQDRWYLTVYDLQTGERRYYGDEYFGPIDRGLVVKGRNGLWYYQVVRPLVDGKAVPHAMFLIANGVPSQTPATTHPSFWNTPTTLSLGGYEVNESELAPIGGVGGFAPTRLKYRKVGTAEWKVAEASVPAVPVTIRAITSYGTKLAGVGNSSFLYFEHDVSDASTVIRSASMFSVYAMTSFGNDVFLAGYPQKQVWRYDTTQPFTALHQLAIEGAKYAFFLDVDRRKRTLYIASAHERDYTGGQLDWVDLDDETRTGYERDYFERKSDPMGLAVAHGSDDLLYTSGNTVHRFDTEAKRFAGAIYPVPGCTATSACVFRQIVAVGGARFFGLFADTLNKPNYFVLDLAAGTTASLVKPLPVGFKFLGGTNMRKQLQLGPDGWVWLVAGDAVVKVNPADGALVEVLKDARLVGAEGLTFVGRDLYGFRLDRLYRVAGAVPAPTSLAPCP